MVMERGIHPPPPPSTPERAPWEDIEVLIERLDRLILLLEAWTGVAAAAAPGVTVVPGVPGLPGPPGPPAVAAPVEVTTPWKAKDIEEIFKESIRTAGTFYSARMVDWTKGKRLVLKVHSTLDQSIQVTVVGNIRDNSTGVVEIGSALPCAAASNITIGLAWDDWHPFVGAKIVVSTAPTTGVLEVEAVVQQ